MIGASRLEKAYLAPFLAFFLIMGLSGTVAHFGDGRAFWIFSEPRYWVCPLQTLFCGAVLVRYWRSYDWRWPGRPAFTACIGVLALVIWIAPQEWLGQPRRLEGAIASIWWLPSQIQEWLGPPSPIVGFDPAFFSDHGWPYAANLGLRLVRLIIVVPLVEEIFWRGFLLRYLIRDDFTSVPIGAFSWFSFSAVTIGFCLEHSFADWPAALLNGALFNLVAYRTRSLSSCVLVHAITNALLGAYVLQTKQWGFW